MAGAKEVLDEALKLAPDERASVAAELLESLEDAPEETADVEAAWAAEIERRARKVLKGESHGTSWDDVRRQAEANLTKRCKSRFGHNTRLPKSSIMPLDGTKIAGPAWDSASSLR